MVFEISIVERAKTERTGSYPIDVRAATLELVDRMGIHTGVQATNSDHINALALLHRGNPSFAPGGAAIVIPDTAKALCLHNKALIAAASGGPGELLGARSRPMINLFQRPNTMRDERVLRAAGANH